MKSIKLTLLAAQIELHWWFIKRERQKGNSLIKAGFRYSSPKLLHLNQSLSGHSVGAMKAQRAYERLDGTYSTLEDIMTLKICS
jgi:hypothetical protein